MSCGSVVVSYSCGVKITKRGSRNGMAMKYLIVSDDEANVRREKLS